MKNLKKKRFPFVKIIAFSPTTSIIVLLKLIEFRAKASSIQIYVFVLRNSHVIQPTPTQIILRNKIQNHMLIPHQTGNPIVFIYPSLCVCVFGMKRVFIFTRDLPFNIGQVPGKLAVERNHI